MIQSIYSKLLIFTIFISATFQLNAACNWANVNTNWSYSVTGGNITVGMSAKNNSCIKLLWSLSGAAGVKGYYTTYTVTKNGTYKICLKLIDSCNKCDTVICKEIKVDGIKACNVDFTATITRDGVKFKPSFPCTGKAVYSWKFGNGTYSNNYDPFVKYAKGTYEVCLTAKCYTYNQSNNTYDSCESKICKKIVIKESPCELKGEFSYKINDKNEVVFIGSANQQNLLYYWTIDNINKKGRDFKMTLAPGVHKVCLTIYNQKTNCKITICKTIEIPKPKVECKIDFVATITRDGVKFKPEFKGCNGTATYSWKFGNGTYSNNYDPFVKYAKGTYEVCLYAKCKIYNQNTNKYDSCESKICKQIVIKESPCELKGEFSFKIGEKNEVTFIGTGNEQNLLYYWTIDNDARKGRDFKMILSPGTHKICLTIYSQKTNCKITICKTIIIKENSTKCNLPKGWSQTNVTCTTFVFDGYKIIDANNNIITNPCHKYSWSFGDGTYAAGKEIKHEYKANGTYTICMKVIDTCLKCDTVICKTIKIDCIKKCNLPSGWSQSNICRTYNFSGYKVVDGNNIIINPCHKYSWSFGDGTYAYGKETKHEYKANGTYTLCMKVIDTCLKCDTMICKTITVNACCDTSMHAKFSDTLKLGGTVRFVNLSTKGVSYKWLFGDNTVSTDKNISHTYLNAGGYKVCLVAYDSSKNCTDTFCKYIQVSIKRGASESASILNFKGQNAWQIYPNPVSDEVNISGFEFVKGDIIIIKDITGKVIQVVNISSTMDMVNIKLGDISSGIYTIECQTIGGQTLASKLIKE